MLRRTPFSLKAPGAKYLRKPKGSTDLLTKMATATSILRLIEEKTADRKAPKPQKKAKAKKRMVRRLVLKSKS